MKKLILFASCISSILSSVSLPSMIYAEETTYSESTNCVTTEGNTSVVKDLLDMKFQLSGFSDFQNLSMNQRLNEKNELDTFIYCYSKDSSYTPKSVFISTSKTMLSAYNYSESFAEYPLSLVSKTEDGCLTKYSISGLKNLFEEERRYNVSMVHYKKESEIKAIEFGMEFYFKTKEDRSMDGRFIKKDVVTITDGLIKNYFFYLGAKKSYESLPGTKNSYDENYYYFFNTDWKIDQLYEVDVQYYSFSIFLPAWYRKFGYSYTYEEYQKDVKKYEDDYWAQFYEKELTDNRLLLEENPMLATSRKYAKSSVPGSTGGFTYPFARSTHSKKNKTVTPGKHYIEYTDSDWFSIKFTKRFVEMDNLMDLKSYEYKTGDSFDFTPMKKKFEFGIRLDSFKRYYYPGETSADPATWGKHPFGILTGTGIDEACITRLKFAKDGVLYDLGTVDFPKSPDPEPVLPVAPGIPDTSKRDKWKIILAIILGVTGLYLIYKFIAWITSSSSNNRRKKHA